MKIIDAPQGTPEWAAARAGRVTASRITDVLSRARDRKSEGNTRRKYRAQLIAEILTGQPQDDAFSSRAMEQGIENEPFARAAYEVLMGVDVERVGFVVHPKLERAGCSPDGLVGADGGVQIKCPMPHTHIFWLLDGKVPVEHEPQLHWEMDCCERQWWAFFSYCPILPAPLNAFRVRLERDTKRIGEITAEVNLMLRDVDAALQAFGIPGFDLEAKLRESLKEAA